MFHILPDSPSDRCCTCVCTVCMYNILYILVSVFFTLQYLSLLCVLAKGYEKIVLLACCRKRKKSISVYWWVDGGRRGKTWGTGVVGRRWMSSSSTSLSAAVCILKLFTRWMWSFFSLLEMKQHVVKWLSHHLEPHVLVHLMHFL